MLAIVSAPYGLNVAPNRVPPVKAMASSEFCYGLPVRLAALRSGQADAPRRSHLRPDSLVHLLLCTMHRAIGPGDTPPADLPFFRACSLPRVDHPLTPAPTQPPA
jgi:hypothetical protein